MQQLKELGLQLAIDDFGTGYSSLSYLHRFPTDTLKIDQSFVGRMDKSQDDREIVHTIIALGRKLGMGLVAEGIEKPSQAEMLLEMGCLRGQGYLFAKPLNVQEATALLATPQELWPHPRGKARDMANGGCRCPSMPMGSIKHDGFLLLELPLLAPGEGPILNAL